MFARAQNTRLNSYFILAAMAPGASTATKTDNITVADVHSKLPCRVRADTVPVARDLVVERQVLSELAHVVDLLGER